MPAHTTKRRTTNIKTKNNQKIALYGSPTTKELKKKHSFRLLRIETGRWGQEDTQRQLEDCVGRQWLVDWAGPRLPADKLGGSTGEGDRLHNPGF